MSNALKYTEETSVDGSGKERHVSYGWKVVDDFFGPDKPGIRLWIASTGNPLDLKEPLEVFKPGFRAKNVASRPGTGHGLYFVRQVVELHGGKVSYTHTDEGNVFSFVLPFERS